MKKKMKEMNDFRSGSTLHKEQENQNNHSPTKNKASKADYIDFEEIK